MSEEIIKILNILSEKIGISINWTQGNIIPYLEQICQKYVNYEIATSIVWIIIGLSLIIFFNFCYKSLKNYKNSISKNCNDFLCDIWFITITLFVVISIIIIITQIFDIVTCITFPEKIIIDELKSIYHNLNR